MAVCEGKKQDTRIQRIASSIRVVPDFPKKGRIFPCKSNLRFTALSIAFSLPFRASLHFYAAVNSYRALSPANGYRITGIMFQDITTLLLDPKAFKDTVDLFVEQYTGRGISVVAGKSPELPHLQWLRDVKSSSPLSVQISVDAIAMGELNDINGLVLHLVAVLQIAAFGGGNSEISSPQCDFFPIMTGVEARGFIFGPPIALAIGAKFVPLRKPRKLPGEVISENYILEYGSDCLEMHVGAVQPGERALVVDDLIATGGTLCAAISLLERAEAEVLECACVIELPELKIIFNVFDHSVPASHMRTPNAS
ncbi:adenine phosphoribosyltransferase [Musa troglodytarum]|uniref:adenine phosphoribosyltransferase n=1 Tax=Musa troglodytarum TaxID=320322 RepID=A0A9E7GSV7_9LILI|nr:adenine phosphoribosyltransferase [Musa troglodytarum]